MIGGIVAGLNHVVHQEKQNIGPPDEDNWFTEFTNFISGGAVDDARAMLAFEATNPSTMDRAMFHVGLNARDVKREFMGYGMGGRGLKSSNNSIKHFIKQAGGLTRLKGGVKQGFINQNGQKAFNNLAKSYGAKIQTNPKSGHSFFSSGKVRVDFTNSSRNIPTIRINDNGQIYKIRTK